MFFLLLSLSLSLYIVHPHHSHHLGEERRGEERRGEEVIVFSLIELNSHFKILMNECDLKFNQQFRRIDAERSRSSGRGDE